MSRPVRVLEIISGFAVEGPLGGIERFGIELSRALPAEGIDPLLCGMWSYGMEGEARWMAALQEEGVEAFVSAVWQKHSPYHAFVDSLQGTKRRLGGQQVDVIHSHCQFGDALALLLQRQVGAKAVVRTVHNEREWSKRPLRRLLFTNLLAPLLLQREMGVSQQVVANLNRRPVARLLRKEAALSYNAVNLERFKEPVSPIALAERRAALGLPRDAILIGSVGRLEAQKGYRYLLDAMPAVVRRIPQAHLLLAGEGTLAAELETQATASPVASHLHLVGPQREIEQLFALLDLFVSSSLWEGLPTVLLESMAAGVPVVATRVSGSIELVREGVTGRLVPPGEADTLAEAIVAALSNKETSRKMADAARASLDPFSIHYAAQRHATLYRELVSNSSLFQG